MMIVCNMALSNPPNADILKANTFHVLLDMFKPEDSKNEMLRTHPQLRGYMLLLAGKACIDNNKRNSSEEILKECLQWFAPSENLSNMPLFELLMVYLLRKIVLTSDPVINKSQTQHYISSDVSFSKLRLKSKKCSTNSSKWKTTEETFSSPL